MPAKNTVKRVCANCLHYYKLKEVQSYGFCRCRELSDMIRGANKCPDWHPQDKK